jgi:hypothetical protein
MIDKGDARTFIFYLYGKACQYVRKHITKGNARGICDLYICRNCRKKLFTIIIIML